MGKQGQYKSMPVDALAPGIIGSSAAMTYRVQEATVLTQLSKNVPPSVAEGLPRLHWWTPISPGSRTSMRMTVHIDGLAQDCSNSSALATELLQSRINSIWPSVTIWQQRSGPTLAQVIQFNSIQFKSSLLPYCYIWNTESTKDKWKLQQVISPVSFM